MTANTTRNAAPQPPAPATAAAAPQPAPYAQVGRIPVTEVFPVVEDGRWPAKAVPGEVIPIRARRAELADDEAHLLDVLHAGNARANEVADRTLEAVRTAMRMDY